MSALNSMVELNVGLLLFAAIVALILFAGVINNRSAGSIFMKFFLALLVVDIGMLLGEAGLWLWSSNPSRIPLLKLCAFLSVGFGSLLNALFIYSLVAFLSEKTNITWRYANVFAGCCGLCFLLAVCSLYNGLLFDIDTAGFYQDGPWYPVVYVVDFGTLFLAIWIVVVHRTSLNVNSILALLSFHILPLLSVVFIPYWYPTPMYLATTLAILMLFILFHREVNQKRLEQELRLAENERRLAEKERDLAESRISITLSQLQPHFLYNVLNTIYHLCERDPKLAQEAVEKFAEYLRNNMKSLEQREPIPFEEEYQHIQTYLALEKVRFRSLEVIYDIDFVDFMVPPLTVQPLVENAVKHGVTKKRGGGAVTISTRETEDAYLVIVADTGVGFVPEHDLADDKVHIGIQNVRERLHHMMGGTLSITSIPGSGTTAVVTIPK